MDFDIEQYVCHDTPPELYRVNYPGSRTVYTVKEGFKASDTSRIFGPGDLQDFKRAIEKHFTWSCRDPVPFISFFSDLEHAENWGRKKPWNGTTSSEDDWALYTINATALKETTLIFKLSILADTLSLAIPQKAQQHIQGAYLCLHHISASAIINEKTPAQVDRGKLPHLKTTRPDRWQIAKTVWAESLVKVTK